MMKGVLAGLAALSMGLMATSACAAPATKQVYPRAGKPFSSAIRIGDNVYVAGVAGGAPDGTYPADFATQAKYAMDGVAAELKLAGATMDDVYSCTIALTNMDDWDTFNTVYVKYFKPGNYPVRMSYGVTSLGGAKVEVQCQAHLGK